MTLRRLAATVVVLLVVICALILTFSWIGRGSGSSGADTTRTPPATTAPTG